jgi:hypothetical protein
MKFACPDDGYLVWLLDLDHFCHEILYPAALDEQQKLQAC